MTALFSHDEAWFTCEQGHDFRSRIGHVARGSWCPTCFNKTERELAEYLQSDLFGYVDCVNQAKFDWCRNPDNGYF